MKDLFRGRFCAYCQRFLTLRLSSAKVCLDLTPGLQVRWITCNKLHDDNYENHIIRVSVT
jgi:hypothetical protein